MRPDYWGESLKCLPAEPILNYFDFTDDETEAPKAKKASHACKFSKW